MLFEGLDRRLNFLDLFGLSVHIRLLLNLQLLLFKDHGFVLLLLLLDILWCDDFLDTFLLLSLSKLDDFIHVSAALLHANDCLVLIDTLLLIVFEAGLDLFKFVFDRLQLLSHILHVCRLRLQLFTLLEQLALLLVDLQYCGVLCADPRQGLLVTLNFVLDFVHPLIIAIRLERLLD